MTGIAGHDDVRPADDSIALLDEWARIADDLSAKQDAVANEAYLGTRTRRIVRVSVAIAGLAATAVLAQMAASRKRRRRLHPTP